MTAGPVAYVQVGAVGLGR